MTEDPKYTARHAGWLLSCDAPKNIEKGVHIMATLNAAQRSEALAYKGKCEAVYRGEA